MAMTETEVVGQIREEYKYGFSNPDEAKDYFFKSGRGISRRRARFLPDVYSVVPSVSCVARPRRRTDNFSNRYRKAGRVRGANHAIGAAVGPAGLMRPLGL